MRISDCSSDVCSSDLVPFQPLETAALAQPCMGLDKVSRRMDGTVGIGNGVVKQRQGFVEASLVFLYANGKIGRATSRERVCQYVWISVDARSIKKNNTRARAL